MFSNPPSVLNRLGWFHLVVLAILTILAAPAAFAEGTATLSGGDGSGSSSFNSAGLWTGVTGTPSAGNQYFTGANRLRSPAVTANASYTFGGDSLSIDAGGALLGKVNGVATETLTLNGANGFYGLYLNGGTVYEGGNLNANGVTLAIAGTAFANSGTTTFIGATGKYATSQAEKLDFQSTISGSGNITVGGTGDSGDLSGIVQLDAANTISGTVSVIAPPGNSDGDQGVGNATYGLLDLNNLNALQNATLALGASFGTTNTTSFNSLANTGTFNVGALSGSGNVKLTDTAGAAVALSVGGNNSSTAYSGNLSGLGSLTKAGTGTLTLSGANTYAGTTTVGGGRLMVNGTHVGGGSYNVNSSGILGGSGTITLGSGAGIFVNSGGVLAPGADGVIRTLTLNGSVNGTTLLTLASGASLSFNLFTGLAADQLAVTSGAANDVVFNNNVINFNDLSAGSLTTGNYTLFSSDAAGIYTGLTLSGSDITGGLTIGTGLTAYTADLEVSGNNIVLDITAVPEPTTLALAGLGGAAVLLLRRKV